MQLKVVLAIQGEGRGHMTQAITIYEWLKGSGHQVTGIIIGGTRKHQLPPYFRKRVQAPVYRIESPGFVRDKQDKSVNMLSSIITAIRNIPRYTKGMRLIREVIRKQGPDLVFNFYEPLVGMSHFLGYISTPTISVAHQYLFLHPSFSFPESVSQNDRRLLKIYSHITAAGSKAILALSFDQMMPATWKNLFICPPLLRKEIKTTEPFTGSHLLVYLVNAGYMDNIIDWHKRHPETVIHCFTDSKKIKDKWEYHENLTFHSLDDQRFLRYMGNAAGVVTTAGFESVCEAFYLNKPLLMIPVDGHAEQRCNAADGERAGAGIQSSEYDLCLLQAYIDSRRDPSDTFKVWADHYPEIVGKAILTALEKNVEEQNEDIPPAETPEVYQHNYSME